MRSSLPTLALALCGAAFLSPIVARAQTPPEPGPAQLAPAKPAPDKPTPDKSAPESKAGQESTAASEKDAKALADKKAMASYKAFFDAKLAGLHAGLELTSAQAPLWPPVETAIRDIAKTNFEIHHPSEGQAADARQGLERTSAGLIRAGQAMKALADATAPLLTALDPDQKERLGQLLQGLSPHDILRKAFNVADERAKDDRFGSDRFEEERERGRMNQRRHHEDHGYGVHRDDEGYGDGRHYDDGGRGSREYRFNHGRGEQGRGRDDHERDESDSYDHGSTRHHGDMNERT